MKTNLNRSILNKQDCFDYLKELYLNKEEYHPEDNVNDIAWKGVEPTCKEKIRLNKLAKQMYAISELTNYPNTDWCPCSMLDDIMKVYDRETSFRS